MDRSRGRAAAIRYDETLPAPFVTAVGRGEMAQRLLAIARRFSVPVESAADLAERLVYLEPGEVIPEELFVPVARILAFVLDLEGRRRADRDDEKDPS